MGKEIINYFYSNPFDYSTDIFFALGIYFLEISNYPDGVLFPGGKTVAESFIKALKKLVPDEEMQRLASFIWKFYGNHRWRKGILTWLMNNTYNPPSQVSSDLRAGHFPDGMKETYYKFADRGQYKIVSLYYFHGVLMHLR
jgi:hypothetical protein